MENQPIGHVACPECRGSGKKNDGTPCPGCEGTGVVAVYSAQTESHFPD